MSEHKTRVKQRLAMMAGLFIFFLIPGLFWLGGYDFNERGDLPVVMVFLTLLCSIGTYAMFASYPD